MRSRWTGAFTQLLLFLSCSLIGCKEGDQDQKGRTVAEAYGERLTEAALEKKVPATISPEDSQSIARSLIRDWVRKRVLIREAQERLSGDELKIEERVEAYRRSLLIHQMEQGIVEKELDTLVTSADVQAYYEEHKKDLILSEPALKYVHVQLVKDSARYIPRFKKAMRKDSSERRSALYPLCRKHAVNCSVEGERWSRASRLFTRMPLDVGDEERFLKRRGVQRYEKEGNIFLLRILEHRAKSKVAPLSLVEDRVRSMILNERKEKIVERVHQNALIDAREKNEVRIH